MRSKQGCGLIKVNGAEIPVREGNQMNKRRDEPPVWWLFLGITLILGGLVLLLIVPENGWNL